MSVQKRNGSWRVRWQDGDRWRSKTFALKGDADDFDRDVKRRQRLGTLAMLDAGTQTLDEFLTETWTPTYGVLLSPKTQKLYTGLYDTHIAPILGGVRLRDLSREKISRWQSDRLAKGAGPVSVRKSLVLLGNLLQRAVEGDHIVVNPVRAVRKAKLPRRRGSCRSPPPRSKGCAEPRARETRPCCPSWPTPACGPERRWVCDGRT
jgi:hypothetical protein